VIRFLIALTGFVVGMAAAAAAILFNPLLRTADERPSEFAANLVKEYDASGFAGIDLGPRAFLWDGKHTGRTLKPSGPGIRNTQVAIMVLDRDDATGAALAVRLSSLDANNSILQGRLNLNSHWNIVWPGQGGYILSSQENHWSLIRDELVSIYRSHRDSYVVSTSTDGFVLGAAGHFVDAGGAYEDIVAFDDARRGRLRMKVGRNR